MPRKRGKENKGLHIQRHKTAASTGKRTVYSWTPELRATIELVKAMRLLSNTQERCFRTPTPGLPMQSIDAIRRPPNRLVALVE